MQLECSNCATSQLQSRLPSLSFSSFPRVTVWIYCMAFLTSRSSQEAVDQMQLFMHLELVKDFLVRQDSCSLLNSYSFTDREQTATEA
uniref:Uncharacterized protein n=1 Tax=Haplochromis burtoni TaxID=8153 RepID=A0A3Q2X532_HAPBU